MPRHLEGVRREAIARDAAQRYAAGESWAKIASDHGLSSEHVRRLACAFHQVEFRRWGAAPAAEPGRVLALRERGASIPAIARELEVSETAVRTALQRHEGASLTRYPLLAQMRGPEREEVERLVELYAQCPPAGRPGHRQTGGAEGLELAQACRKVVDAGVPMETLSKALGRGATWVHTLLHKHELAPDVRPARLTALATPSEEPGSDLRD